MANGRCRVHGGASIVKTGRYSLAHRASLAESVAAFRADPEPGNLLDELAVMRALTQDAMARFADGTMTLDVVEKLSGLLAEISRMVERIAKVEAARSLAAGDADYLLAAVADILNRFVPEHDRQRAIESLRGVVVARSARSARAAIGGDAE
jgi:hypothetical protein